MAITLESEYKRLRGYLNPAIRGKNTDSIIESLATGSSYLINNIQAINDQLYIVTASGRYLDERLAGRNITRPDNVGLSDEVFRELGIEISTRKQIRDLILKIQEVIYGEEYTRATVNSSRYAPYALANGDSLVIQYDDTDAISIFFEADQFSNINAATAQEVADAITRSINTQGRDGLAVVTEDENGQYVTLISSTRGPSSSIRVLGGRAQNELRFPEIRPTSVDTGTQFTLTQEPGGSIRMTWSGGASPSFGKVRIGDYVNIYGGSFDSVNFGTYAITAVKSGDVNDSYVEYVNVNGIAEIATAGSPDDVLFYNPKRFTINDKIMFATTFQTEARLLEIFLPATTRVVRRDRIGAAYIQENTPSVDGAFGPYIYDTTKGFTISDKSCVLTQDLSFTGNVIVTVDDVSAFPDQAGYLVFGYGTSKEEGPVQYLSRPSSGTLMINPSYKFKNFQSIGTEITLIDQNFPYEVDTTGIDYPLYLTDIVSGRLYAEELIRLVAASGINLAITILYPNDIGLGKWGTDFSEKVKVWGPDEV